jgi:nucleoside 2-deoxyribosyltransferase
MGIYKSLYLAGPITGLSYGEATDWRQYVADNLPEYILPVSPMRGKQYLGDETSIAKSYEDNPLSCQKGITCRDRDGVKNCDMLFVNFLGAKTVSIGTVMEVAWADAYRKPIVIIMDELHNHPILKEVAGFVVHDIDTAIKMAEATLMVGVD